MKLNPIAKLILALLILLLLALGGAYGYGFFKYGITTLYGTNGLGRIQSPCVHCGSPNRLDAKYCSKCNELTYHNLKCPKCGQENILTDTLCVGCGEKISLPWDFKFRMKCLLMKKTTS